MKWVSFGISWSFVSREHASHWNRNAWVLPALLFAKRICIHSKSYEIPIERLLWFKSEIATTETERAGSFARHENPLSWPFPLHAQTICHRIARTSVRFATNFSLSSSIFFISSRWIAANFRWKKNFMDFIFHFIQLDHFRCTSSDFISMHQKKSFERCKI